MSAEIQLSFTSVELHQRVTLFSDEMTPQKDLTVFLNANIIILGKRGWWNSDLSPERQPTK
jgi:hypothetical protein